MEQIETQTQDPAPSSSGRSQAEMQLIKLLEETGPIAVRIKSFTDELMASSLSVPTDPYMPPEEYVVLHLRGQRPIPGMR